MLIKARVGAGARSTRFALDVLHGTSYIVHDNSTFRSRSLQHPFPLSLADHTSWHIRVWAIQLLMSATATSLACTPIPSQSSLPDGAPTRLTKPPFSSNFETNLIIRWLGGKCLVSGFDLFLLFLDSSSSSSSSSSPAPPPSPALTLGDPDSPVVGAGASSFDRDFAVCARNSRFIVWSYFGQSQVTRINSVQSRELDIGSPSPEDSPILLSECPAPGISLDLR